MTEIPFEWKWKILRRKGDYVEPAKQQLGLRSSSVILFHLSTLPPAKRNEISEWPLKFRNII